MTDAISPMPSHPTTLDVDHPIPPDADAGTQVTMNVRASCPCGCDLSGAPIHVVGSHGIVSTGVLATAGDANYDVKLVLTLPSEIGAFVWSVTFPGFEAEGAVHEGRAARSLSFRTVPHKTSMAVWDVRSPVASDSPSTVKVGMRCSSACRLAGHIVELGDDAGTIVAEGALLEAPWIGTEALYWAEVDFRAPLTEGVAVFHAAASTTGFGLPHEPATATFSLRTTGQPEHRVAIKVCDRATGTSLGDVEVRLGHYLLTTNAAGVAAVHVPSGTYEVGIRKDGFAAAALIVDVRADETVVIEAVHAPTMADMAESIARFEGYPWG